MLSCDADAATTKKTLGLLSIQGHRERVRRRRAGVDYVAELERKMTHDE